MNKILIACIIGIITVLAVVFLSQQAYFKGVGNTFISTATNQDSAYLSKGSSWAASNIYSKIGGEVQNGGDLMQNGINQTKEKISDSAKNISEKIQNYFSGIGNSILGKENNNNCQTQPAQTSPGQ